MRPGRALRAELARSRPGAVGLFADLDSPISPAVLPRDPSLGDTAGVGPARMAAFPARGSCGGRRSPAAPIERPRRAPRPVVGPAGLEARRGIAIRLVSALEVIVAEIAGAVRADPDGQIVLGPSIDPNSTLTAATLPGETSDVREHCPTREALCADAGMSPVAIDPGERRTAVSRRACGKRLRAAVGVLADATRHRHTRARDPHNRARA